MIKHVLCALSIIITPLSHAASFDYLEMPRKEQEEYKYGAKVFERFPLEIPVRVLLKEDSPLQAQWVLEATDECVIYNPVKGRIIPLSDSTITVSYKRNAWQVNEYRIATSHLYLVPTTGRLSLEGVEYDGFFSIHQQNESLYLVNHLDLEDYIAAVLPYESVPSWPAEVQRALCIACRSYAVYTFLQRRSLGEKWLHPYDLKATVMDQVYKGHTYDISQLRDIVDETKHVILTYKGRVALTMFCAVCGGVVPAQKKSDIYTHAPYLKRAYACTHCSEQRLYRWDTSFPLVELEKRLRQLFPDLGTIEMLSIEGRDDAGIAQNVLINTTDKKQFSMEAFTFRMLFSAIRSTCCNFSVKEGSLSIQGKGFGHHIGLCQWGAYAMVQKGYPFKEVLSFYYPGTKLARIKPALPK